MQLDPLSPAFQAIISQQVSQALAEDIGVADYTATLTDNQQIAHASVVVREPAVICGFAWVEQVFQQLSDQIELTWHCREGERVQADQVILQLRGPATALLTGERTALNFLQTLSAVSTLTRRYVELLEGTQARIMDTRKTIPGLRLAQKYAVKVGGGMNQRLGLYDGILIKENHIMAAGSIAVALQKAQQLAQQHDLPVQIEVENLDELQQALQAGAKLILLDNFSIEMLKQAVQINQHQATLEASGGVTLDTVREIALTGVDRISTGDLTKNIQAIDLSMRLHSL